MCVYVCVCVGGGGGRGCSSGCRVAFRAWGFEYLNRLLNNLNIDQNRFPLIDEVSRVFLLFEQIENV